MKEDKRYVVDCRKSPGSSCSLTLAGTESELLEAVVVHATHVHGYKDSPELTSQIRSWMEEEAAVKSATT